MAARYVVARTCNAGTRDVETRLQESEASLSYTRPFLETNKPHKTGSREASRVTFPSSVKKWSAVPGNKILPLCQGQLYTSCYP